MNILIFDEKLYSWRKFVFLAKICIFDEILYFWRKFEVLTKISIFFNCKKSSTFFHKEVLRKLDM